MANSFFHRLSAVLWSGVVLLLLFLAVYVSVGRLLVSSLDQYRDAILQELNLRVPFTIEADSVAGEWRSFNPVIVMSGLRLTLPESTAAPLELTGGQVGVDVWSSLLTRSLQATHVIFEGLSLHAEFSSEGKLRLRGLAGGQGESGQWLQEFLVNARHLSLRDNLLRISLPSGELREFDLNLQLQRKGSDRRVEGKLTSTRGTDIAVLAEGVGNPFRPEAFSGELYIDMQSSDFGAVQDLLSGGQPALWTEGELDVALWLSWDRGVPSVATRVNARDLLVTPREGDWRLPLERIAFEAHVVNERDRLTLYATDVEVDNGEVALQLPGLQLDAWGSALRLRARDIPVATMSGFVAGLATTPEPWRQLITDLDASGSLSRLQLDLAEYERPFDAWEFEANFADLALAPYKGAPGASAARGHVQLDQDGGTVVLDGRDMSLDFPRIYRHSLDFDELFGTLHLHWDAQSVGLSSDLLTAVGEEGMVKALFGLDIPLQPSETGVEMELLVGLEDVHPRLREKYIPETLDDGLRKWLQDSIGDGLVREGAFLWRGALKSSAAKLRTVQLGFNVSNTQIEYHPDWPAATLADGVIMIDDGRVRAWSNSARMLDSQVSDLSVAVAPGKDKRLQLDVAGGIDGPASDVLSVINESPLADIVGDTFSEWRVQGAMRTDLDLRLQLGEGAPPPEVAVATRWRDVDATISPGDVTLRRVSGALDYTSAAGFSSSGLAGSLWDRDVALEVRQLP
ncbi:MAG: DUF3971 domain-containing protein, partial [Halioglobus sp.]|nr:DUF3971 domain-containing protein [Halioglobus sp.]